MHLGFQETNTIRRGGDFPPKFNVDRSQKEVYTVFENVYFKMYLFVVWHRDEPCRIDSQDASRLIFS